MSTDMCPTSPPPGYFYRSGCTMLCRPATWSDVLVFFLGNYVTHVATIVSQPGQSLAGTIFFSLLSMLFPGGGISKAMGAIMSRAVFAPTELRMAARAGALYIVVPTDLLENRPRDSNQAQSADVREADNEENGGGGE